MMEEIENGFRITHEGQMVEATFDKEQCCLRLAIDEKEVTLYMGESGYFLAFMATWYDSLGD
jgi:hypothetical protein